MVSQNVCRVLSGAWVSHLWLERVAAETDWKENGIQLTSVHVLDDDVSWVVVEQDTAWWRHKHALRVFGVVKPDTVLIVQRTSRATAVQLYTTFNVPPILTACNVWPCMHDLVEQHDTVYTRRDVMTDCLQAGTAARYVTSQVNLALHPSGDC